MSDYYCNDCGKRVISGQICECQNSKVQVSEVHVNGMNYSQETFYIPSGTYPGILKRLFLKLFKKQ